VVLDRERFPRFHVGESLLPLQGAVLERLGVAAEVAAAGFVPKYGALFIANDGSATTAIDFESVLPPPHNFAYQVERARVDDLLLRHAAAAGAEVLEGQTVVDAELSAAGCRLRLRDDGAETTVAARWVIDASGQGSFLARRLELRATAPDLRKVAHFAHFERSRRHPGRREGDITIVLGRGCWFWHIPLSGDRVSVGCVVDHERWKASALAADAFLPAMIATSPWLGEWLAEARRATEVHTLANFSYTSRRFAGPGYLLAGDAATFLDPIFSTGVLLALSSGEAAALALARPLAAGRAPDAAGLTAYGRRLRRWTRAYFRLIRTYYRPDFGAVVFSPTPFFVRPLTHFLAGGLEIPWRVRAVVALFRLLVRANGRLHFVPDPRPPAEAVPHG
jgi:flavin-dependent dehydrogenase